jgi:hypothetical protein
MLSGPLKDADYPPLLHQPRALPVRASRKRRAGVVVAGFPETRNCLRAIKASTGQVLVVEAPAPAVGRP